MNEIAFNKMHTCKKVYRDIPFAHRQWQHEGHCRMIHGHNWTFEFTFACESLDPCGFVVDFGRLGWLKDWLNNMFDHHLILNRSDPQLERIQALSSVEIVLCNITLVEDSSCEGLARFLYIHVNKMLNRMGAERGLKVVAVTVHESISNSATFSSHNPSRE